MANLGFNSINQTPYIPSYNFLTSLVSASTTAASSTDGITWNLRTLPISTTWTNGVVSGKGINVTISAISSAAASSTDGITWTLRTMPGVNSWRGPVYANNIFVATTAATTTQVSSSTDGITWDLRTFPTTLSMTTGITYVNNLFYATNNAGSASTSAASSTDGITWNLRTLPTIAAWSPVAYDNNIYVSVSSGNASTSAASSTDGITWNLRTLPVSSTWLRKPTYVNNLFVTTSYQLTTTSSLFTSTDGITWNARTLPGVFLWYNPIYANNIYVAIPGSSTTTFSSSTDGITWDTRTAPATSVWNSPYYLNNLFIVIGSGNSTSVTSTDGITWDLRTLPVSTTWNNIVYINSLFVLTSGTGTSAAYSTNGITWTLNTMPAAVSWLQTSVNIYNESLTTLSKELSYLSGTTSTIQTQLNTFPANNQTFYIGTQAIAANQATGTVTALPGVTSVNGTTIPANATLTSTDSQTLTNTNLQNVTDAVLTGSFNLQQNLIGQIQQPISATTYTVQPIDKFLVFNGTAACTVTLPSASTYPNREIVMKQIAAFAVNSASSNVQPLTSTTAGTAILSGAGKFATIVSNGSAWQIIKSN